MQRHAEGASQTDTFERHNYDLQRLNVNDCLTTVIKIWLLGCFLSKIKVVWIVYLDQDLRLWRKKTLFSFKLCLYSPKIQILILICSWAECEMADWHANEQESKARTRLFFPESLGLWAQTQGQAKVNGLWYGELSWVICVPSSCQQLPSVLSKSENKLIRDCECPEQTFTPQWGFCLHRHDQ